MAIEIKISCPLGHTCERTVDNHIERCAWYTKLTGKNPQNDQEYIDEWGCAIAWLPILSVEMAGTNRGQTAAIESFRNETVKRQEAFLGLAHAATQKRLKSNGDES